MIRSFLDLRNSFLHLFLQRQNPSVVFPDWLPGIAGIPEWWIHGQAIQTGAHRFDTYTRKSASFLDLLFIELVRHYRETFTTSASGKIGFLFNLSEDGYVSGAHLPSWSIL
jgi:hypothetical protein